MTAARHAWQIMENTTHVLAVELYTAARAIDLRLREHPTSSLGLGTEAAYNCLRETVPYQPGDALWGPEIESVKGLIQTGIISEEVNQALRRPSS